LLAARAAAQAVESPTRSGQAAPADVLEVIERLREKNLPSVTNPAEAVVIETQGDDYGEAEKVVLTIDRSGRFHRNSMFGNELGEVVAGFDGTTCWQKDQIGLVRPLSYSDRDVVVFLSMLRSGLWISQADVSTLSIDANRSTSDQTVFAVAHHRAVSRVMVSAETGLATKLEFTGTQGEIQWEFSDYEETLGWRIPMTVTMTDPLSTKTVKVAEVRSAERTGDPLFKTPAADPPKIEFDAVKPADLNIHRSITGHVLVDIILDDGEPQTFIFDTGAGGTAIDKAFAEKLNLRTVGEVKSVTVYSTDLAKIVTAESLEIGPARLRKPRLVTMDLEFLRQMMQDASIVGIIGYDLLSQCVCEIELATDDIRIFDSETYGGQPDWSPITFYQNIPLVPATFSQGEGMFRIDVGASSGPAGNVIFRSRSYVCRREESRGKISCRRKFLYRTVRPGGKMGRKDQ
jgi:hypothetical protein